MESQLSRCNNRLMATRIENISKPQKQLMDVTGLGKAQKFDNV